MVLTLSAVAENKGIALDDLNVDIERQTIEGKPWETLWRIKIDLPEGLMRRERAILYNAARRCEVHKLLSGKLSFDYDLAGGREG